MSLTSGLDGRVAVVTGATGGMGRVIALNLARRGATVVTIARDPRRADDLRNQFDQEGIAAPVEVIPGDLSHGDGVRAAAEKIAHRYRAVHLLINNAGAHFPVRRLSSDGVELHVAVDYLAAFGMTALLTEALERGSGRVVNVVSDSLNDTRQIKIPAQRRPATLDATQLQDLRALNPAAGFAPFEAYARAKLLTVMAAYDFARRLAPGGVTVNSVHPGIVATGIIDDLIPPVLRPARGLIKRLMLRPEEGAAVILRVATNPSNMTGVYFLRNRPAATPAISYDLDAQHALYTSSARHFA